MFVNASKRAWWKRGLPLVLVAALFCGAWFFTETTGERAKAESLRLTRENIRRAAVQCYALEGFYPMDVSYLYDHYGIRPDEDRFVIYYQFVADNLMPDITVIPVE